LVDGVAAVAQSLSTVCVAEGIETMGQYDALRGIGVKFGQGFLFSPPIRGAVCDELLAQASLRPADA
jgi:EAL domain-containing protein (putative c-di-GMP-specific phosphodiesterase class I)